VLEDAEKWANALTRSLTENDRAGEQLRDRAPSADLKALIVRPEWHGAKRDGTTNDSTAIQAAITAAGENGCVAFSDGAYLVTTTVNLPATNITLMGFGTAVLDTSGSNSIFKQTVHGALVRIDGIKFTGGGPGVEFACADGGSSYYEYAISNCTFAMDSGIYGLYLVGAREGTIENCYFWNPGSGIYRSHSNVCVVRGCIFRGANYAGTAIYDNGLGSAYSCGLSILDCVIMGWEYGVIISRCEDFNISGSTIDYNTYNFRILGQNTGTLTNCFIGSVGTNPAILIDSESGNYSYNLIISNNKIVGHTASADYDCISINDASAIHIIGNYIAFYTRYGISYADTTYLDISHNIVAPRGGSGTNAVYSADDDGSNKITWNNFVTYGESVQYATCWENYGGTEPRIISTLQSDDAQLTDLLTTGSPEFYALDSWGDTRIGVIDGAEIVVNGGFASDTSSWAANDSSIASVAGGQAGNCLEVTRSAGTSTFQSVTQASIAGFVVGHKYRFSGYIKSGTYGENIVSIAVRPDSETTDVNDTSVSATTTGSWVQITNTFTATETAYDVILFTRMTTGTSTTLFDTISVKELVPLVDAGYATNDEVIISGATKLDGKALKIANSGVDGSYTDSLTLNLSAYPTTYGNAIASTCSSVAGSNGIKFKVCDGTDTGKNDVLILGDTHITALLATIPTGANDAGAAAAGCAVGGLYRTNADPSVLCIRAV
jgi:hypothetical protein